MTVVEVKKRTIGEACDLAGAVLVCVAVAVATEESVGEEEG